MSYRNDWIAEAGLWALRRGIGWGQNPHESPDLSPAEWEAVWLWARKQAISALVWDGFSSNDPNGSCAIPGMLNLPWCAEVARIEANNEWMNARLEELVNLFRTHRIAVLLLKGQGVARFYPRPNHRQCGDMDLYVGEEQYKQAEELMNSVGERLHHSGEEKHVEFRFKGVVVEIHYLVTRFCNPLRNRKLRKLVADSFPERLCLVRLMGGKTEVSVFPAELDAFYQLTHIFHHLLDGGVGLRPFCDWGLLIHTTRATFNRSLFGDYIRRFRFRNIYGAVAYVAVFYLGLEPGELPLALRKGDLRRGEFLVQQVLSGGNFGKYRVRSSRVSGKLLRPLGNYLQACRRSVLLFSFSPSEVVWMPVQKFRFYLRKQRQK